MSLYAVGTWPGGQFVAMRLIRGTSLARLAETGRLDPGRAVELLTEIASALDAAHRAGIAHGAVVAQNILVDADGHALLSDFGLAAGETTPVADRGEFASLVKLLLGERSPELPDAAISTAGELAAAARSAVPELPTGRARRRRFVLAGLGLAAVTGVAVVLLVGDGADNPEPAPPVQAGARALGSSLAPGGVESVDCTGEPPSGASQACTIVQIRLPGRELVPREPGLIRSWAVRGASGQLALQVVRRVGDRFVPDLRQRATNPFRTTAPT